MVPHTSTSLYLTPIPQCHPVWLVLHACISSISYRCCTCTPPSHTSLEVPFTSASDLASQYLIPSPSQLYFAVPHSVQPHIHTSKHLTALPHISQYLTRVTRISTSYYHNPAFPHIIRSLLLWHAVICIWHVLSCRATRRLPTCLPSAGPQCLAATN